MLAHLVQTGFGGFYDGLAHWALCPRDVMITVAMTVLAALGGAAAARRVVVILPVAWLAGGMIGSRFAGLGEMSVATSVTIGFCGALAALDRRLPPLAYGLIAALAGGLHGLANGSVMRADHRPGTTLLGAVCALALITLLLAAALAFPTKPAARIALRVAGSWLAAIALLLIGWELRGAEAAAPSALPGLPGVHPQSPSRTTPRP